MTRAVAAGESASLSRELADFLVQLSIAMHKHAIYPPTHPMLSGAVDGVISRLAEMLGTRTTLSLGVARSQLVIEGIATDPENPLLRELAQRLHRHHLGAVKFSLGVTSDEIADFLSTVAADADRTGDPLGDRKDRMEKWPHVRLYPLSYGQLELVEKKEGEEAVEGGGGARGATLWIGLARAALAAEEDTDVSLSTDPAAVAKAIDAGSREVAYDQVIVGYLLQIANELKSAGQGEAEALKRRVTQMVGALRPETVSRLLGMGGNIAQRRQFVLDAAQGMAADVVVQVVQAAADASGETISHSLLRLLSKLAAHAQEGTDGTRGRADTALREQVTRLVADWELEDPNPEAYRAVLEGMSRAAPAVGGTESASVADSPRILAMSLELGVVGPPTWLAVKDMLANGQASALFDFLSDAGDSTAAAEIWQRIATADRIREALATEPVDLALLERMVARLGILAAVPMLEALAKAERRATRWKLITLMGEIGEQIVTLVVSRLADQPWFMQRNLLLILEKIGKWPTDFSLAPYARHADARVRREAVRMMLALPDTRELALRSALVDSDQQVVQMGLGAAIEHLPPLAAPLIIRHATEPVWEPRIRALAIRVLASIHSPGTLDTLLRVVMTKRKLFGRERLHDRSPEVLAALSGLAMHWRAEPKAIRALSLARRSSDSEVRAAVEIEKP